MLWRQPSAEGSFEPYNIFVSELMLQQTQVSRVTPKYAAFLDTFPTIQSLAAAPLSEVLQLWSGLGYNRRAKFLWQAALQVVNARGGVFPDTVAELVRLPGVGPNTAGAIMAYAYNQPVVYIETNIRTVIIHHYFQDASDIPDAAIRTEMERIVSQLPETGLGPREFYWAMMDYGSHLKQTVGNLNRASRSYTKQSVFAGSRRQLRGQVIRLLTERPYAQSELVGLLPDERTKAVVEDLVHEALIARNGDTLSLQ